jgi:pyruvate,water dikinase
MRALLTKRYTLVTINDYAYYDIAISALESARIMVIWPPMIPRVVAMLRRARMRWADEARPRYAKIVAEWDERDLSATPAAQLLEGAREIVMVAADHYLTVQSGILPVAYLSEALFSKMYSLFARRKGDPPALTFLLGFDSAPIQAEKSLYDIAAWAQTEPDLAAYLKRANSEDIVAAWRSGAAPVTVVFGHGAESWREFSRRLSAHLNRFGHAVYDLDFAKSLAADDPAPLLEALKYFLAGQARDPHMRQSKTAVAREEATQSLLGRLRGPRRRMFGWLLRAAQCYAPLREDALMDVGLGWPLLRKMLREVGRRFAGAGAIVRSDDVFWLNWDEAQAEARALDAAGPSHDSAAVVAERRAKWQREQKVTPPVTLPAGKALRFLGINFSTWLPARTGQAAGDTIRGIGASPGCAAGVARVIHGPGEFNLMRAGDILVAKITTPAWTPLFALAAGVVTDIGGPLSHSSIVAREYQIPAVLGTGVATERICSGQHISVDGDRGVVKISPVSSAE